jgi:hypothetical protein
MISKIMKYINKYINKCIYFDDLKWNKCLRFCLTSMKFFCLTIKYNFLEEYLNCSILHTPIKILKLKNDVNVIHQRE